MDRNTLTVVGVFVFLVAAVTGGIWIGQREGFLATPESAAAIGIQRRAPDPIPTANEAAAALIGGPFRLTDQNGKTVTEADLRGHWSLVYFGYTFCPDVCPLALQHMTAALDDLGRDAAKIVPYFITVDPERDTQAVMAEYARHFHPSLRALTGTPAEVKAATDAFRVYAARQGGAAGATDYLMDHTSVVYILGPDGKYVSLFTHEANADAMTAKLKSLLRSQG